MLGIYDTLTMLDVLRVQKPPTTYWLDNFFQETAAFETAQIFFDEVIDVRRLAPFVSPNVQGRVMREDPFNTKAFRPAYVKPKHVLTPERGLPRMPGEQPLGTLSIQQRIELLMARNLKLESDMIWRRWDWMACAAIVTGGVTVAGDDYPAQFVNFGRDASLDIVLTGAATWDNPTTAKPLSDIMSARQDAFNLSRQPINRLTFGVNAWAAFAQIPEVLQTLNDFYRGSNSVFNTVTNVPGPYEFKGSLAGYNGAGTLDLWMYNDEYEDDTGTTQPYMDPNLVVGTGNAVQGIKCYGAIMDMESLVATDVFPKSWIKEDPSVRMMMTQSAPLMLPKQPNASFSMLVLPE
jgi:hypothetical protein